MKGQHILINLENRSDEWKTPQSLVRFINKNFKIDIDPWCSVFNVRAKQHFTKKENGLRKAWNGNVYLNPPYSEISKWMDKAYKEHNKRGYLIICLTPARTGTAWFHQYAFKANYILFISKRLKFDGGKRKRDASPFDSCLIIFGKLNRFQHKALKTLGELIKLKNDTKH